MIYFITGGARSGKSSYAQREALQLSGSPYYVATANVPNDEEFERRVNRHKHDRDDRWTTIEEPLHVSALIRTRLSCSGKQRRRILFPNKTNK